MSGDDISMQTKAGQPLLSVRDLRVSFGASQIAAVKSISFDVYADETIAIVGESGSGKSVTALAIMRLLDARRSRTEGSIEFLGTDLLGLSPKGMRAKRGKEISMVFQEPMTSLNPLLSVGRQISEVLTQHNGISHAEASKEAERLLDQVRIPSAKARLNDYPHQFSGGMRQRVMIASAIACRPRLLIADEPTTALDVTIQAQVLELLRELQAEYAMTVMFITHDMGVVAEVADRTMVMYRGDLVETAETTALFATQHHPYTRSLLLSVPKLGSMSKHASPQRLPIVDPVNGDITIPESSGAVPACDEPPVLEVKNLSVRFAVRSGVFNRISGRVHAVENVSFELLKGETLAVVGESGSGKSTTGRAIIKLVGADEGRIILQGEDINTLTPAQFMQKRRKIQMIFQDPLASLDPRQTIVEAVVEPILVHRLMNRQDARLKALDLFEKVGLQPHLADRYPHQLSGGQRQRVCIARALGLDPQVIIADEAVSALDVSVRAQVINLMIKLQEELGLSYLFISHDMAVVERISHRVAVMYLGEIVEIGPRTSIFGNPQHPYTRKLIAAVPIPDPSRRGERVPIEVEQLRSPIRQLDHVLLTRPMCEVSDGHFVRR